MVELSLNILLNKINVIGLDLLIKGMKVLSLK